MQARQISPTCRWSIKKMSGSEGNPSPMSKTITMYRPTGPKELALVRESGFRRWPPRLPDPVTNEEYAVQIARDWNVKASGQGFVTRFQVRADYMAKYKVEKVGGAVHTEWWVPAEELEKFNDNIVGLIEVIRQFP
jgi:hypothetical protein